MWEFIETANGFMVGAFGVSFLGLFGMGVRKLGKIASEKHEENKRNKKAFEEMKKYDGGQDKRIEELENYNETLDPLVKSMIEAQKASLHNQLWNKAEIYLNRGWITVGELNNFEIMYHAYKGIGGNHTGDTLHDKVLALPVRDEGILRGDEI